MKKLITIILMAVFFNTAWADAELEIKNGWPVKYEGWWEVAEPEDIQKFIDNGADVNARLITGVGFEQAFSVLNMAGVAQNTDVIKLLIKAGAKVNKKTKSKVFSSEPWDYTVALARTFWNPDAFQILIENGANYDTTWLMLDSNTEVIKLVLDYGFLTKTELKNQFYKHNYKKKYDKYLASYQPKKPLPLKDYTYSYPGYESCLENNKVNSTLHIKNKCNFDISLYMCLISGSGTKEGSENEGAVNSRTIYGQCGEHNRRFQRVYWLGSNDEIEAWAGSFRWFACGVNDIILYNRDEDKATAKNGKRGFACKSRYKPKIK